MPLFRPWLRRLVWLAAPVVAYTLAGFFVAPVLMRWGIQKKASAALKRQVTVADTAFNPFTLEARLGNLRVLDRDRQPLFSVAAVRFRLGPSGVFRRAARLRELTIDRPSFQVRVLPNGKLSFADLLVPSGDNSPPARLIIDHLQIRGGKLDVTDESVTPRWTTSFTPLNAELHDLVTIPGEKGDHALSIGSGKTLIRIAGRQSLEPFGFTGHVDLKRLDLGSIAERFASVAPILPRAGELDAAVDYDLHKAPAGVDFRISRGELIATGISVGRSDGQELLALPRLEVHDASLAVPAQQARVGSIRIIEPRTSVAWDSQGKFNWATAPSTAAPAKGKPWQVLVDKAAIENGALHFADEQRPVALDLTNLTIDATGITNDTTKAVSITAKANNGAGTIALGGTITPSPFVLDCKTTLSQIDLTSLRSYMQVPGMTLGAGSAGFGGRLLINNTYLVEGDGTLDGVELVDAAGGRLLGCRKASMRQARFDGAASKFRIRGVEVDGMYANVVVDKQRKLNLAAIGGGKTETPSTTQSSFAIGTIRLVNSTIDFRDESLALPYATSIRSARGSITDFSTTGVAPGSIKLDGNVAEHGSMTATGSMRMSDPLAGTDVTVNFRSVPMPDLTPYAAEFAGYSIEKGDLDLDLHYAIAGGKLKGDNRVVAKNMTLGGKVGGSAAGFAVRLAVALLKDRDGKIDLVVPIEGPVDDPQFDYRSVMWQAVKTILGNAAKAPFRALAHSMGITGDNLELVSFDPGESTIAPPQLETLHKVGSELASRPEIELHIEGRFDTDLDTPALKKAKLESLIAPRRDSATLDSILESLYTEAFSADRLAAERAKFPNEPAGFYDALHAQLLEAQPVSNADLQALAKARADAIAAAVASTRVKTMEPAAAKRREGSQQIDAEMKLQTEN